MRDCDFCWGTIIRMYYIYVYTFYNLHHFIGTAVDVSFFMIHMALLL